MIGLSLGLSLSPYRAASSAPPPSGDIFDLLDTDELAFRNSFVTQWAGGWEPGTPTWDDTVVISDEQTLYNFLNGTAVSGVTRNVARNQRVRLATPFTNNRSAVMDRFRGLDWLAAGKQCLLESETAQVSLVFQMTISGSRGVHIRNIRFPLTVTQQGGDPEWTPAANSVTITAMGMGYQVGDVLTFPAHANIYEVPTLTVASVGLLGALTGVSVDAIGVLSSNATGLAVSSATGSGAVLTLGIGTNPRDAMILTIQRTGSFPLFPVVRVEDCDFGSAASHPSEWLSCVSAANCEQVDLINCTFNGYQTANRISAVRRFFREGNDYQNWIGDAAIVTNSGGNTVIGGVSYNGQYPDAIAYAWSRFNTVRNGLDDANATTPGGKRMGLYLEHTDFGQAGTSGDTGDIHRLDEFDAGYLERSTYRDAKGVRYSGGTQGQYNDDTTDLINGLAFSCIHAPTATASFTGWNAFQYRVAYCTGVRVGNIPPNGDGTGGVTTNLDVNVGFLSRRRSTGSPPGNHYVRKCVMGTVQTTSGSGYIAGTLTQSGNVVVSPVGGAAAYASAFPTLGAVDDAQGRMSYTWTDDGVESQAAFRARMFAAFGQANEGVRNPTEWV